MYILPQLNYSYDALEPFIDEATMRLHHLKHHQTYIDKLNAGLENWPEFVGQSAEDLLRQWTTLPEEVKTVIRNHGGGHANHSLWWNILAPATRGDNLPPVDFLNLINDQFGSFFNFKKEWTDKAIAVFGSGWVWLVVDEGKLKIITTANQDSPLMTGLNPILGLDVWEHAYYLKYQNKRADYINNFFSIINWSKVVELWNKNISQ